MNKLLVIAGVIALLTAAAIVTVIISEIFEPVNVFAGLDDQELADILDELSDLDLDDLDDLDLDNLDEELEDIEDELEE